MMTGMELFFFVVLPVSIVTAGWIAVCVHERNDEKHRIHPDK